MVNWYEEPKVIKNGKECPFVIHKNVLPGPILCARAHAHDYIEMLYCLEGTHEILLDRKSYTFTPGDMVLISSNEVHQIQAVSKETSCYIVVRFEPEILYTTIKNAFELKYILPFAFHKTMPQKGRNMAIAEWPCGRKQADYALFIGTTLYAVIEAKKFSSDISTDLHQSKQCALNLKAQEGVQFLGEWEEHKVPFLFSNLSSHHPLCFILIPG